MELNIFKFNKWHLCNKICNIKQVGKEKKNRAYLRKWLLMFVYHETWWQLLLLLNLVMKRWFLMNWCLLSLDDSHKWIYLSIN